MGCYYLIPLARSKRHNRGGIRLGQPQYEPLKTDNRSGKTVTLGELSPSIKTSTRSTGSLKRSTLPRDRCEKNIIWDIKDQNL